MSRIVTTAFTGGIVLLSLSAATHAVVFGTVVPGSLAQGTVKSSLGEGTSYALETNNLGDFPLDTGGTSTKFPVTLTNADFNGNSFGGTPNTMIAFGAGGGVTISFSSAIHPVPAARELGIFTGQMLLSSSGSIFNGNMQAAILVSADNLTWRMLAGDTVDVTSTASSSPLNAPTVAYNYGTLQKAWSYGAGTAAANLAALPIADYQTPMPSDALFNDPAPTDADRKALSTNTDPAAYAGIFGASAGGNWFDLSATGLTDIRYLRLNAVNVPTTGGIRLDAVFATPASVPEPAVAFAGLTPLLLRRKR